MAIYTTLTLNSREINPVTVEITGVNPNNYNFYVTTLVGYKTEESIFAISERGIIDDEDLGAIQQAFIHNDKEALTFFSLVYTK